MWQVQKGEGRGRKTRTKKGEQYFPRYPPPPCFSPLLKSTIDACHMLKSYPSKSVYNHHYIVTKYAKNTKHNKHRKSHFKDAIAKDVSFKWTCNWLSSKVRTTFLVSVVVQIYFCLNLLFFVFGILVNDNEFETKNKLIKPRIKINDNWLCGVKE